MAGGGIMDGVNADMVESWINTADNTAPSLAAPQSSGSIEVPREESVLLPPDSSNPRNWLPWKKWCILVSLLLANLGAGFGAVAFLPARALFEQDFGLLDDVGTLGWTLYVLGLALGPVIVAPASEFFGRTRVYLTSSTFFFFFLLGTALVQTVEGFMVFRVLAGVFASAATANVTGSIADLWLLKSTGLPVNVFVWATLMGYPFGFFIFSFIAASNDWRLVFWALLGIVGGFIVLMATALLVIGETRHTIIAKSQSKRLKFENENLGRIQSLPRAEKVKIGTRRLLQQAMTRPFRFFSTESIVLCSAAYIAYIFALAILFSYSFPVVFGSKYGFSLSDVGLAYLGPCLGITLGLLGDSLLEWRHRGNTHSDSSRTVPTVLAKIAAVTFPLSMFWYAWTTFASVHWIAPILASTLWAWSFYALVAMVYQNLIESYGDLSASAVASVSLLGNLAWACFPLFGTQMFTYAGFGGLDGLSTQEASTILACLALVIVPVPFLLERYGDKLKSRSPWARKRVDYLSDEEGKVPREKVAVINDAETARIAPKEDSGETKGAEETNVTNTVELTLEERNDETEKVEMTATTENTDTQGTISNDQGEITQA